MNDTRHEQIEKLLRGVEAGEPGGQDRLVEAVYDELRSVARGKLRRERPDHSWQTTDLVHEVYPRLFVKPLAKAQAPYFWAAVGKAMSRALIDHDRKRKAEKRPPRDRQEPWAVVIESLGLPPDKSYTDLDRCLERLQILSARQYEVVVLRIWFGNKWKEIAAKLEVSVPTAEKDWQAARAWLRSQLEGGGHDA